MIPDNKSISNVSYTNNTNDIYVYFELSRMYEAKSILDIGMFLTRCGALSRQVKDAMIPPDTFMCGIPLYLDVLPVHVVMYDSIASLDSLYEDKEAFFDIVFMLNMDQNFLKEHKERLLSYLVEHTARIIFNDTSPEVIDYLKARYPLTPISVDDSTYFMIG